MIPQIDDLIQFGEENEKIIILSKTYKLNAEDELLYIDEYLENITFNIENGNLIEKIKEEPALINFSLENGNLIASTD